MSARKIPERWVAPTGERDFDGWMVEGLCAFGSGRSNVAAGLVAGVALPWGFAILAFLYAWVNNAFAPEWGRVSFGPARIVQLLAQYDAMLLRSAAIFGAIGGFFAWARRGLLLLQLRLRRTPGYPLAHLLDSRFLAAVLGWALYAGWALWPRGPGGEQNFGGALQHVWIWIFFGVIFSGYLHWGQATLLYRLYLWRWEEAAVAIARRLIAGQLALEAPCAVEADGESGAVVVRGLPKGAGAARLNDLLWHIPGVSRVRIEESGEGPRARSELLTLHIPDEVKETPVGAMLRTAEYLYRLGIASGFIVYAAGLVYAAAIGSFYETAGVVVVRAIQVEVAGWLTGAVARTLIARRAQKRLPGELRRTLAFYGRELGAYRFGRTWKEFVVEVNLTRDEARRMLAPVVARFGVERLLVRVPAGDGEARDERRPAASP